MARMNAPVTEISTTRSLLRSQMSSECAPSRCTKQAKRGLLNCRSVLPATPAIPNTTQAGAAARIPCLRLIQSVDVHTLAMLRARAVHRRKRGMRSATRRCCNNLQQVPVSAVAVCGCRQRDYLNSEHAASSVDGKVLTAISAMPLAVKVKLHHHWHDQQSVGHSLPAAHRLLVGPRL
jgi:hypothetical protein